MKESDYVVEQRGSDRQPAAPLAEIDHFTCFLTVEHHDIVICAHAAQVAFGRDGKWLHSRYGRLGARSEATDEFDAQAEGRGLAHEHRIEVVDSTDHQILYAEAPPLSPRAEDQKLLGRVPPGQVQLRVRLGDFERVCMVECG